MMARTLLCVGRDHIYPVPDISSGVILRLGGGQLVKPGVCSQGLLPSCLAAADMGEHHLRATTRPHTNYHVSSSPVLRALGNERRLCKAWQRLVGKGVGASDTWTAEMAPGWLEAVRDHQDAPAFEVDRDKSPCVTAPVILRCYRHKCSTLLAHIHHSDRIANRFVRNGCLFILPCVSLPAPSTMFRRRQGQK